MLTTFLRESALETSGWHRRQAWPTPMPLRVSCPYQTRTFLEKTQEDELDKIKRNNPNDWQRKIYERFDRLIKKHGILHLLKKGLSVDDAHFNLMYPAPLASSSEKVKQNFETNIFWAPAATIVFAF